MFTPTDTKGWSSTTGHWCDVKILLTPFKQILFILFKSKASRARVSHCAWRISWVLFSLSFSFSLLSFHLLSSLYPASYRSPVDENKKEMGEAVSRERHKIKFKTHIIADFLALCFIRQLELLDWLVTATISMETGAKSWASAGHGEKGQSP